MSSFGEELRRERELRGITLREIADSTKINIRFLEALENNDFKHLPGEIFNKGFVRAYAAHIGLDPERMVNSYLLELSRQAEKEKGQMKFAPILKSEKPKRRRSKLIFIILVILAALAALILLRYRQWSIAGEISDIPSAEDGRVEDSRSYPAK
ncbi:MAG: helix-turn-helix domain-containing protein [Acidobacteriota bacterium]